MNCNTFHSKINDLLEDDCLIDFKDSMEEHRDNCKSCKAYYEEELEMHRDFKQFFSVKDIQFKSLRGEIINSINKNQYKNNYLIQICIGFNKHKKKYIAWVAVFVMIFLATPKFFNLIESNKKNFDFGSKKSASSASTATQSIKQDNSLDKSENITKDFNVITFEKHELERGQQITPIDTWKESNDGKYSACVSGKIYIKENVTGRLWSFAINNQLNQENTPIFLEWSKKEEALMVTVGNARGIIAEGGGINGLN